MRSRSIALAVPLLLGPGILALFSGGYSDTARAAAGVAAWLLLAATAIALPRPLPRDRPAQVALAALAALSAWTAISLAWAPLGEPAGEDVQRLLLYLAALAAATRILREPAARLAEPLLLAGISGAVLYGLSERLVPGVVDLIDVLSAGDRLAQPLTYWNGTGAFAALGLVLAAGLAGTPERPAAVRAGAAAAAPVLGLALYLTFSRGGLGAAAAGLAVLIALAPTRAQARAALLVAVAAAVPALATLALPAVAREKSGGGQGAAMIALLLVTAGGAALLARRPGGAGTVVSRMRALAAGALLLALAVTAFAVTQVERRGGKDEPEATPGRLASVRSNRYAYWKVALRTLADHPVAGAGSGGFQAEWLRERPFREPVRDAHSLYVETPAELGLVGLALLLTLLGAVAVAARHAGRALAGPVAALAAFALHAGVDWDWELPALTLVALALAGLVLATSPALSADPGGRAP